MRLIDADALKTELDAWARIIQKPNHYAREDALYIIDCALTIDAVPVVRGEWKMDTDPDDGDCRCSSCKVCIDALHRRNHKVLTALGYKLHTFYKYCPNCGAKMESEGE